MASNLRQQVDDERKARTRGLLLDAARRHRFAVHAVEAQPGDEDKALHYEAEQFELATDDGDTMWRTWADMTREQRLADLSE